MGPQLVVKVDRRLWTVHFFMQETAAMALTHLAGQWGQCC